MDLYRTLLATYAERHRDDPEAARRCLEANDLAGLRHVAHTLCGAASILGIGDVAQLAEPLAHATEDMPPAERTQRLHALAAAQQRVVGLLDRLPSHTRVPATEKP